MAQITCVKSLGVKSPGGRGQKNHVVTEIANIGVGHSPQNVLMCKVNNNQLNVICNLLAAS